MNTVGEMKRIVADRTGERNENTLLRELNLAWQQLWAAADMPGSYKQMYARPAQNDLFLALPQDVAEIRAVRWAEWGPFIQLNQPQNFYGETNAWQNTIQLRFAGHKPYKTRLSKSAQLTLTLARPAAEAITVAIEGQSVTAQRDTEAVTILAGEQSATTEKAFGPELSSITKTGHAAQNIFIQNSDGEEIAVLKNDEEYVSYYIVQLHQRDVDIIWSLNRTLDILYRARAKTFWSDRDAVDVPLHLSLIDKTVANILSGKTTSEGNADPRAAIFNTSAAGQLARSTDVSYNGTANQVQTATRAGDRPWMLKL